MKKRALALALAGVMTASLTACGTYQNSGTETTKAAETTTGAAGETTAAGETASEGEVSQDFTMAYNGIVTLNLIFPLSFSSCLHKLCFHQPMSNQHQKITILFRLS